MSVTEDSQMTENTQDDSTQSASEPTAPLMSETDRKAAGALVPEDVVFSVGSNRDTIDDIFDALSHPGRRYVLTYLLRADGYVTMTDLVDYVMKRTHPVRSDEFRRQITIELTHTVLPKLNEDNLINYNIERQLISSTDKTVLAGPFLKLALVQHEIQSREGNQ